jgi:Tol biopolymer transport system component
VATKLSDSSKVQESLSLAKTSDAQVTVERDSPSDIWVTTPGATIGEMKAITASGRPGRAGLCWQPDGRIIYHSHEDGKDTLWSMNADGDNAKPLTPDSSGNFLPSISGDGRQLVFASRRTGVLHVWRMDLDSGAQMQLTGGSEEQFPQISSDGKWAYYNSWDNGAGNVWKISINGGQPIKVVGESSYHPQPAPDGQFLAYGHLTEEHQKNRRKIIPEKGGPAIYSFSGALARLSPTRWSRDGRALLYLDQRDGAWNVWSQPVAGGEPSQLTHFTGGRIYFFDQSWDGKRLAVSQGNQSKDVVLNRSNR